MRSCIAGNRILGMKHVVRLYISPSIPCCHSSVKAAMFGRAETDTSPGGRTHKNIFIFINGTREDNGWTKEQGVGVLKDKVLKLEEMEVTHTLGSAGEGHI